MKNKSKGFFVGLAIGLAAGLVMGLISDSAFQVVSKSQLASEGNFGWGGDDDDAGGGIDDDAGTETAKAADTKAVETNRADDVGNT